MILSAPNSEKAFVISTKDNEAAKPANSIGVSQWNDRINIALLPTKTPTLAKVKLKYL
jgi:hypothetical protein